MQQLEVAGAIIDYVTGGSGTPVLLSHGALMADAMIVPLAGQPALASCRLIGYHRRGYAAQASGEVPGGMSLADDAADAAALLDHLGVARAHAVGHSSGALICMQLARDRPDLVGSLALLEPPLAAPDAMRRYREEILGPALRRYAAGDSAGATDVFLGAVLGRDWRAELAAVVPGGADQATASAGAFFGRELPAIRAWDFGPAEAAAIAAPVLSVLGTSSDPFFAGSRPILHEWFGDVEDCDLAGVNHQMQVMDPAAVAAALAAFFARHPL